MNVSKIYGRLQLAKTGDMEALGRIGGDWSYGGIGSDRRNRQH